MFNVIQTFYVDAAAVQGAPTVLITGVDLFFKSKPSTVLNTSGTIAPGVSIRICDVLNDLPVLTSIRPSLARVEYSGVFAVSDSSISTSFVFDQPVVAQTGKYYGIVVKYDDPAYQLWSNKIGDALVGTNQPSPGSGTSRDGFYFSGSQTDLTPTTNVDLKFSVNIAKFDTTASVTLDLFNKNYEFLTVNNRVGTFKAGEDIFVANTQYAGTLSVVSGNTTVTGTGTNFAALSLGQKFIIQSNGTYRIATVYDISNTTSIVLQDPLNISNTSASFYSGPTGSIVNDNYVTNKIILNGSTANSTISFSGGAVVRGSISNATSTVVSVDNLNVDKFTSHINVVSQSVSTVSATYNMAQANGASFVQAPLFDSLVKDVSVDVGINKKFILSRSNEVGQSSLFQPNLKSADVRLNIGTTNPYIAPFLTTVDADITIRQMLVSNTVYDSANSDTEITGHGIAFTKHFTKKMTFEKDRRAEDIRVFAAMYRPAGTDVRMYAKIWNAQDSEPFDDKMWTPLEIKLGKDKVFSSSVDKTNFIDFEFGFPSTIDSAGPILAGTFNCANNSTIIVGTNTVNLTTVITPGQYVSVYDPLFPQNELIVQVVTVAAGQFTVNVAPPSTFNGRNVRVLRYSAAFVNTQNTGGIVRYFNLNGAQFDGYNTVQVKVVLLANDSHVVPLVDEMQVIGLSA
jgi:hypothetical protein